MGPRQMTGLSPGFSRPIEIIFTPCATTGIMRCCAVAVGSAVEPSMMGTFGPYTSASSKPTLWPSFASARARFTATVVFPTPPFPLATATRFLIPGIAWRSGICPGIVPGGMAQCSPLIRASQKPSETLQVARAQAAARSDHTVCPPLRADPPVGMACCFCGPAKASIKRLTLDRSPQTGLPGASSACAVALLIFFPRTARTRIVASHLGAGSDRLGGFCLRGPGLILHLLLLPFLLALECPRKVRQALRRHLHACRRTGSGRCGWRRSKRSRRLRPWLARLLRRRFTLLDLHVEEVAHRFVVDARHHVFEQDKGFLLEFDKWILLAVATKPDPLLQMVERKQVVFPLRVDDIENDAALEPTEEFCAELFLFLRVAIPHRFDGRFHQLIMIQGCRIRACRFCLDSELAMHFGEKLRGVPLARMLLARAIGFDCLERHILRDSEDVIALVLVFEGEEESRRARVALASRAASQLVVDAARLVALRTQNVQAAKGHNVVVLRLALFGELLVDRLPLFLRHLENLAFVLEQHHGRCCLRGVAVCAFRTDDRGRGGVRHG